MKKRLRETSLSQQVFFGLIVGELLFAVVLGVTIGAFSSFSVARQRADSLRQISATIAAGLMPMIADQQSSQVDAQLSSIMDAAELHDVTGIRLVDATGAQIASRGTWAGANEPSGADVNPWSMLLDEQVLEQDIVVDGLRVAAVKVRFAAQGLSALVVPTIASGVVLLTVMLVSVPWTAWRLTRDVTEPLDELKQHAVAIADGDLDTPINTNAYGEIRELQDAAHRMATQLKERDERLLGSYADLSVAYERLAQANVEIERLADVKSNFVAVAAHEIRGPLSTITLYSELMESGELGELDEGAHEAAGAISAASERLASIVSDLMDAALLERGMLPIEFGEVWIAPLLEDAIRDAALLGRPKGMDLHVEGELPDVVVRGDSLRLRQVFDNVLSNAVKYSPEATDIAISAEEVDDHVDIHVADRGRGIPEGSDERLFALFGRLDFGDSRDTAGLGLGLAISARIVDAHGGRISYRANPAGSGSIFTVCLPLLGEDEEGPTSTQIAVVEGSGAS